jgi:hypothetical protein
MCKVQRQRAVVPLRDHLGNFLYNITHVDGSSRCAAGTARPQRDYRYGRNVVVGYRLTEQAPASNSRASSASIAVSEMEANAVCAGSAQTALQAARADRKLTYAERAQIKTAMWTRVPLVNPQRYAWGMEA